MVPFWQNNVGRNANLQRRRSHRQSGLRALPVLLVIDGGICQHRGRHGDDDLVHLVAGSALPLAHFSGATGQSHHIRLPRYVRIQRERRDRFATIYIAKIYYLCGDLQAVVF